MSEALETPEAHGEGPTTVLARARGASLLGHEDERRLARLAERGDRAARERLVTAHLPLVVRLARERARDGEELADLVQEGLVGLLRAVDRFDWRNGARLSTYAAFWIRQAILRATQGPIREPEHRREARWSVAKAERRLAAELGRAPSRDELASFTGLGDQAVERALEAAPAVISLDGDASPSIPLEEADVEDEVERREVRGALASALSSLPERLRALVALRYGLDGGPPLSLADAGDLLGLDRNQAYRLETAGLRRLARDSGLRRAAGKLRSLFPFGVASPWSGLKGLLSGGAGAKVGAVAAVVAATAGVGVWQGVGPFGPEAPSGAARAAPPSAAADAEPAPAPVVEPPTPTTPPASARERLGRAPQPAAKPAGPGRDAVPATGTAVVSAASQAASVTASEGSEAAAASAGEPAGGSDGRPPSSTPAAPATGEQEAPAGPSAGGPASELASGAVGAVEEVVGELPLPPPVEEIADAAVGAVGDLAETAGAVADATLPAVTDPDLPLEAPVSGLDETLDSVLDPVGGLPGR